MLLKGVLVLLFGPDRPLLVALLLGGFAFLPLPLPRPPLVLRSFRAITVTAYEFQSVLREEDMLVIGKV
jgi:hypothetical protein